MATELKLPVYVLVDNDPWGLYIYSVLKQGSISLAYESMRLAVPNVRFLGMSSLDYEKFNLSSAVEIKLNDKDVDRARQMKAYPWFKDKKWQKEMDALLHNGFKMELDGLLTEEHLVHQRRVHPPRRSCEPRDYPSRSAPLPNS
jgi:DNA topoisomerase-6 subunit A